MLCPRLQDARAFDGVTGTLGCMSDLILGVIAVAIGLMFLFRGFLALRAVIGIWGAFVGFAIGMAVMRWATGFFLGTALAWFVAFIFALVFGALAYLYYAVGVVLAMGSIGYGLGAGLASLANLPSLITFLFGLAGAAVLALFALLSNLPRLVLIVLSAGAGAAAVVGGAMFLVNDLELDRLTNDSLRTLISEHWWWNLVYVGLFIAGIVGQMRLGAQEDIRAVYHVAPAAARRP